MKTATMTNRRLRIPRISLRESKGAPDGRASAASALPARPGPMPAGDQHASTAELRLQLRPVGGADHALFLAQLAVPRVQDRGRDDPLVLRPEDVLGAVVDQHVDLDLGAARDLVEASSRARRTGGRSGPSHAAVASWASCARWLVTWMKWPASCQSAHDLDCARVRRRAEHVHGGVALGRQRGDLLGAEPVDVVGDLVLVGERHAEPLARELGEDLPVVVERRVDVDGDAHGYR